MMLQPTDQFMDKYIAPGYSGFTAAMIPDMSSVSPEQGHWLRNFVLNSCFRAQVDDATRQTFYNFLRRAEAAFREYELARRCTLEHLARTEPQRVSSYIEAISHWEQLLSQLDLAWDVLVRGQQILFIKGDGSVFQRLKLLYNTSKHLDSAIRSGQLPPDGTLPVWLTSDGLQAVDGHLTFAEISEILTDLANWAEAAQDPLTMRDTIRSKYGIPVEERGA